MIFSQVVLALRTGVQSRLHGYALSTLQFATFLLPVSLVHRLPTFYYGALCESVFDLESTSGKFQSSHGVYSAAGDGDDCVACHVSCYALQGTLPCN